MTVPAGAPVSNQIGTRGPAEENIPGINHAVDRAAEELQRQTGRCAGRAQCPLAPGFLSRELRELSATFDGRSPRLADVLAATKGCGYHLLLLVLALPFVSPIPLPGFSIPFGVTVAVVGLRLALHQEPWLPRRVLQYELPAPPHVFNSARR